MALVSLIAALLLLTWAFSGVTFVPLSARAIAAYLGTPTAVLRPGLHLLLPWPLASVRAAENGAIHHIERAGPPLLTAGQRGAPEPLDATAQVLFRIGAADADALRADAIAAPDDLVRATADRLLAAYATQLSATNGSREAEALRQRLQAALDQQSTGIEILAVAIQSRAPGGKAEAAGIAAYTAIATAHASAAASTAQSRQTAYALTAAAHAGAAETVARAQAAQIHFAADQQAAKGAGVRSGSPSFLLERYFAALTGSLGGVPKTIIDHRLNWPEAPVLDLRPLSATAAGKTDTGLGSGIGSGSGNNPGKED